VEGFKEAKPIKGPRVVISNIMRIVCCICRTTAQMGYIIKMSRLRVVDNSNIGRAAELAGKPAKCIQVYNKPGIGYLGDKVQPCPLTYRTSGYHLSAVLHSSNG